MAVGCCWVSGCEKVGLRSALHICCAFLLCIACNFAAHYLRTPAGRRDTAPMLWEAERSDAGIPCSECDTTSSDLTALRTASYANVAPKGAWSKCEQIATQES